MLCTKRKGKAVEWSESRTNLFPRSVRTRKKRKPALILGVAIPIKSQGKDHCEIHLRCRTGASPEMSEA